MAPLTVCRGVAAVTLGSIALHEDLIMRVILLALFILWCMAWRRYIHLQARRHVARELLTEMTSRHRTPLAQAITKETN